MEVRLEPQASVLLEKLTEAYWNVKFSEETGQTKKFPQWSETVRNHRVEPARCTLRKQA